MIRLFISYSKFIVTEVYTNIFDMLLISHPKYYDEFTARTNILLIPIPGDNSGLRKG